MNVEDQLHVLTLRDFKRSVKHVSYHPNGGLLMASSVDGSVYIYNVSSEEPRLIKRLDSIVPILDSDSNATSKAVWHPGSDVVAIPAPNKRDVAIISRDDWKTVRLLQSGHGGDITDVIWSPNGDYIATSGMDNRVILWDAESQVILCRYSHQDVISLTWHPSANVLSFATGSGTVATHPEFVPQGRSRPFGRVVRFPGILQEEKTNGTTAHADGIEVDDDADSPLDWIEDDDGAGYAEELRGLKRALDSGDSHTNGYPVKRQTVESFTHKHFQPGSTPWRGNRRYLALNFVGFVWTVDQDTHNTITIEFNDEDEHRSTHFTDYYFYDKACLNEVGTLFASDGRGDETPKIFFRPHKSWGTTSEWMATFSPGEEISCVALTSSYAIACTSSGFVKTYTIDGTPVQMYKYSHLPIVTCTAWENYVMVVGNGAIGSDGQAKLQYTIESDWPNQRVQSDVLPLPPNGELKSVFFSEEGDPMLWDSDGVLLTLAHWRVKAQAKWVPLLDSRRLARRVGKQESYWPVAVAGSKLHCIILKGGEQYPFFPRPITNEFDFEVPFHARKAEMEASEGEKLEQKYLLETLLYGQEEDLIQTSDVAADVKAAHKYREAMIDKTLLQLVQIACKNDREEQALSLVGLLHRSTSLEAASKIALYHQKTTLGERINEVRYQAGQH